MAIDLTDIGIEEGQKYEGIYTTMSKEGVKNAAPIGIVCKGKDKLGCRRHPNPEKHYGNTQICCKYYF